MTMDLGRAFMSLAPVGKQVMPDIVTILHTVADLIPLASKGITALGDNFLGLNGGIKLVVSTQGTVDETVPSCPVTARG
jgi:hypothetical protein